MRVLIAGASGFLGRALATRLEAEGTQVVRLGRARPGRGGPTWDPAAGKLDPRAMDGVTAIVNLAGESIGGGLWTAARRRRILGSRVSGTTLLAKAAASRRDQVTVLINSSAVGFYGDRGEEELTEQSAPGTGFLAGVCQAWEAATQPATDAGIRVVIPRTGVILDPRGGMLGQLLPLFRLGLGARLGNGRQWLSWIALDDTVALMVQALRDPALSGPVNAVSPAPVRNAEFTRVLARAVRRPALFCAPAVVLRTVLGDLGRELLLGGQRCAPAALAACGFEFAHPALAPALERMLADGAPPAPGESR